MERMLLDTNILVHLVRGSDTGKEIKSLVESFSDPQLFISVVSLAEAESLVVQWRWPGAKIETLIASK